MFEPISLSPLFGMTIPFVKKFTAVFQRQPKWSGLGLGLAFLIWAAAIGYIYIVAPAPSEEDIAGQTVQLNAAQLEQVTKKLETYRKPAAPTSLPNSLFGSPLP